MKKISLVYQNCFLEMLSLFYTMKLNADVSIIKCFVNTYMHIRQA